LDLNGGIIPDSQGRCCQCSVGSQLGLASGDGTRGGLNCALFGTGQGSAHCLRFDPLWYNVYRIEPPIVSGRVYTTVLQRAEDSTTQTQVRVAGGLANIPLSTPRAGAGQCSCGAQRAHHPSSHLLSTLLLFGLAD